MSNNVFEVKVKDDSNSKSKRITTIGVDALMLLSLPIKIA